MRFAPIAIAIAITTICSVPALAESGNADDQRFSFHKVDDGLRLDGRTGVVALCTRPESGWLCRMVPDERSTVEVEIARLASENAALKSALREREGRLPGQPPRPPAEVGVDKSVPSDAEVDRVMAFMGKLWRRMLDMMADVQRDFANKS